MDLARFRQALRRGGAAFLRRVFTAQEVAYARARRKTTLLHLAARFAAKEAVTKALSQVAPASVPAMHRIEVRNDSLGRPRIVLHGARPRRLRIEVSLSHEKSVAVASAIILR